MLMDRYHISLDSVAYTVNGPLVAYGAGVRATFLHRLCR